MNIKLLLCSSAVGLLAVSCFDDSYDLSDIDTTSRVEVNNLVIPINFDAVTLSDIIKLDEDSPVKEIMVDGVKMYAVSRTGDFDSDPIFIKAPIADAPNLESQSITLPGNNGLFTIPELGEDFTFSCNDVDKSIVDITNATLNDLDFNIEFVTPGLTSGATYDNVKIQLPKGMTATANNGTYEASTGIWTLSNLPISGGKADATLTATSIDFTKNDFTFESPKFDFTSTFSIIEGTLKADDTSVSTVDITVNYTLSELNVTAISGKISYTIEGMELESISLNDLPTFLNNENTNIVLNNPLICLQTNNPVAAEKLEVSAALALTAYRDGVAGNTAVSDNFTVGYNLGVDGLYNTILSPEKPSFVPDNFSADYKWFAFNNLGSILAGEGLPQSISVNSNGAQIPTQSVVDFELGRNIPGVKGQYELFAPLAFGDGTVIFYSDTKDGWGEDVQDLFIDTLTIEALATNNTPLEAQLTIYPLDVNGNRIPGVDLTSSTLLSGQSEILTFTLTGQIKGLDGVEFFATINPADNQAVAPNQSITFENIRVKVNGYYERKL